MTRVVHLQTHLPSSGNAAFRLHLALLNAGVESTMLSLTSDISESEEVSHLGKKAMLIAEINAKVEWGLKRNSIKKYGLFSYPVFGNDVSEHKMVKNADIIYLHWVLAGFLNFKFIEKLAKLKKPIIFFTHDMWAITGGCHHSFDCDEFISGCKSCQMFENRRGHRLPGKEFQKKRKLYEKYDNFYFVSPSHWLQELTNKSGLTRNKPHYHIPNVINSNIFKSCDKRVARQILNLKKEKKIIAFGAISPKSPYKGWEYLKEALHSISSENLIKDIEVLVFGSDYDKEIDSALPFHTYFMGRLRDDYSTVLMYNAADIFLAPSLADNLPTTVMESLCCGTPVVGFNVGGIPDMINHKKNGYLANYRDAQDLANGIKYCLEEQLDVEVSNSFDSEVIIHQHLDLYRKILPQSSAADE